MFLICRQIWGPVSRHVKIKGVLLFALVGNLGTFYHIDTEVSNMFNRHRHG